MKSEKIQTLLFDLDGTLVDSRDDLANAVNYALEAVGQPRQSQGQIIPHVGNGLRVLMSGVLGLAPDRLLENAIRVFSSYYDEHCVDHTILYEDVQKCLQELDWSVRCGVVTNKPERFARKIVNRLGVAEFLSVIIGGDSCPEKKPHPAPVLKAMNDLSGSLSSTLLIGDGAQDILAGQAARVHTCVARYGYGFQLDLLKLNPDFQINHFAELKEIVS